MQVLGGSGFVIAQISEGVRPTARPSGAEEHGGPGRDLTVFRLPVQNIAGARPVVGVGGCLRAHVHDHSGSDQPAKRDLADQIGALEEMVRRVEMRPAVFGGGELLHRVEETRRGHPLGQRVELESLGVGRPVERVLAVPMTEIHRAPPGDGLGADFGTRRWWRLGGSAAGRGQQGGDDAGSGGKSG